MIEGLYCVQLYRVVDDFHYDSTTFWSFDYTDMMMSYMMTDDDDDDDDELYDDDD